MKEQINTDASIWRTLTDKTISEKILFLPAAWSDSVGINAFVPSDCQNQQKMIPTLLVHIIILMVGIAMWKKYQSTGILRHKSFEKLLKKTWTQVQGLHSKVWFHWWVQPIENSESFQGQSLSSFWALTSTQQCNCLCINAGEKTGIMQVCLPLPILLFTIMSWVTGVTIKQLQACGNA